MTRQPLITVNQGNKVFENGVVALQDLNLQVNQSEFVSLVGPSGCGKSTLLRIVAGLISLSSGSLVWGEAGYQPEIAFVFQEPALLPWMTVKDNILLPLKLAGIPHQKAQTAVSDALQLVGLESFKQAYPRQLSGGMKMRTSIARALVTSPHILLMDEPFGALDALTRGTIQDELIQIVKATQQTVFMITHDVDEAILLADKIILMRNATETDTGYTPGGIAEVVMNPLPAIRKRADLHHLDGYYDLRNHIVDFLVGHGLSISH